MGDDGAGFSSGLAASTTDSSTTGGSASTNLSCTKNYMVW